MPLPTRYTDPNLSAPSRYCPKQFADYFDRARDPIMWYTALQHHFLNTCSCHRADQQYKSKFCGILRTRTWVVAGDIQVHESP
jgi:hypothetical protein